MLQITSFPVRYAMTPAAQRRFDAPRPQAEIARIAVRALLRLHKGFEIAHLQFRFRGEVIAVCSRVDASGAVLVEIDLGNPALPLVAITEAEFGAAQRRSNDNARAVRLRRP